jgi:hypothetical protein
MTAFCVRAVAARSPLYWLAATFLLTCLATRVFAAAPIAVMLDEARILKLPDRATTVVIGNPMIADLAIQPGGLAVVTGKAFGATNVIVMDKSGAVLTEQTIEVKGPRDRVVVVYRGISRATYSCTPDCGPRVTLGDDPDYFTKVLNESATRNTQAMTAGSGVAH